MLLDGRDLGGARGAHARAQLGLARTWQSGELFDDLLVEENLAVAQERSPAWRIAFRSRTDQRAIEETLALFDLGWAAKAQPRRPARRAIASSSASRARSPARPRVLMLDEPAAGLDTAESEALGAHLRAIADGGQSTLLIDHDMGLVLSICDRVVVLEFGEVIADGAPETVRAGPARDRRLPRRRRGGARRSPIPAAPGCNRGGARMSEAASSPGSSGASERPPRRAGARDPRASAPATTTSRCCAACR